MSPARCFPLVLCLCALPAFSGCEPEVDQPDSAAVPVLPFPGVQVTVFAPKSADDSKYWEIPFSEWEAQTGGSVDAVVYDDAAGPEALLAKLNEPREGGTVVLFPLTWRGQLDLSSAFAEMPNDLLSFDDLNWQDVHKGLRENLLEWSGDPTFLSLHTPLLLMYYRQDLLEAANLKPPQTWDEYRELLATLNEWAPGMTAVEPWSESNRTTTFLARSIASAKLEGNFSVFLNYLTGEPMIDTEAFQEGLSNSVDDLKLLSPQSTTMSADQCLQAIVDGKAAIAIGSAFPAPTLEATGSLPEDAAIAALPLPGTRRMYDPEQKRWTEKPEGDPHRVSLTGWNGTLAGVYGKGQDNEQRAAWSLLKTLFVTIGPDAFAKGRMTPSRLSLSSTPYAIALPGIDVRSHAAAVKDSFRDIAVVPEMNFQHRDEFREVLDRELGKCLAGEQTPESALSAVSEEWKKLLEQHDRETIRQSYARGLGIPIRN